MTTCEEFVMFGQSAVKVAPPAGDVATIVANSLEIFAPEPAVPELPRMRNWLSEFRTPGDVCVLAERKVETDILYST
jgi:hypothetical protein